jgi:hypothetical protein
MSIYEVLFGKCPTAKSEQGSRWRRQGSGLRPVHKRDRRLVARIQDSPMEREPRNMISSFRLRP